MAFVTVGTTKFDALVAAVDDKRVGAALAARGFQRLVMQVGSGAYKPKNLCPVSEHQHITEDGLQVEWFNFAPGLGDCMRGAALIISHAGAGSLFEAMALQKRVIAVPNAILMHNHQVELAEQLAEMGHVRTASPECLLETLETMDMGTLVPYERGDPAAVAQRIDGIMGFAAHGT